VGSVKRFFSAKMRFGRSSSSKVTYFGTDRRRVSDFLLIRHNNLGPILHHFRDIACFVLITMHPYSTLIFGVFPLHRIANVGVSPSIHAPACMLVHVCSKAQKMRSKANQPWNYFRSNSNLYDLGTWTSLTDGQTDRLTDRRYTVAQPRSSVASASRGKNERRQVNKVSYVKIDNRNNK